MNKPWWYPVLCDAAYCDELRKDYPENADMDDETLIDHYNEGRKYQCLWDHVGDAYEDWEPMAEAYLKLVDVYEAAKLLSDHMHVPNSGEHLARPDHHNALMDALAAAQPNHKPTD